MRGRAVAQKDIPILDLIDVCQVRIPEPIRTRQPDHNKKSKQTGEIHTEVELHKAGYLKGEQIRLNIKIKHTKAIKNLKGAIVTFYRMSRFDSPKYYYPVATELMIGASLQRSAKTSHKPFHRSSSILLQKNIPSRLRSESLPILFLPSTTCNTFPFVII